MFLSDRVESIAACWRSVSWAGVRFSASVVTVAEFVAATRPPLKLPYRMKSNTRARTEMTTVLIVNIRRYRVGPSGCSSARPNDQKKNKPIAVLRLGALAKGQVTSCQTNPRRYDDRLSQILSTTRLSTAYANHTTTEISGTRTEVVTSTVPIWNQGSPGPRLDGREGLALDATHTAYETAVETVCNAALTGSFRYVPPDTAEDCRSAAQLARSPRSNGSDRPEPGLLHLPVDGAQRH
jgi:hypothetical protein